jgi:hypothetical protein
MALSVEKKIERASYENIQVRTGDSEGKEYFIAPVATSHNPQELSALPVRHISDR